MVKKNEIKVMRIKPDKEREKVKYLDEKLAAMEKHKDQICRTLSRARRRGDPSW